jgi:hypothetical protein
MATSRNPTKLAGGGVVSYLPILSTCVIDSDGKTPCLNLLVVVRRHSLGDIFTPF